MPSNEGSEALLMIWVMTTVGRLFGLYDMMRLKHKSIQTVYLHLTIWQFVALVGMTVALVRLKSNSCFWVALCLYGFGNGPTIGHSYDLINRLTRNTEQGMSLVMFGLNFGASLVPYTTTIGTHLGSSTRPHFSPSSRCCAHPAHWAFHVRHATRLRVRPSSCTSSDASPIQSQHRGGAPCVRVPLSTGTLLGCVVHRAVFRVRCASALSRAERHVAFRYV